MAATLKCDTIQNASSATANLTLDTSGNATVGNTLAMGSSFKRNRIINGNMQIWQRSTAPTAGALGSFTYNSVDRWSFYSGSTSSTQSQNTSVPTGFQYSLKLQRTAASTGTSQIYAQQIIETVNCLDLAGQNVTLSFYAKRGADFSASGNLITVGVYTGTVADQGGNSGAWTGLATPITTNQGITTTWTRYTFTGTIAANALEVSVLFGFTPTGTAGADDAVYITGVQLEVGSVATPYERQIYSDQLIQCQRYYEVSVATFTNPMWNGYSASGTTQYAPAIYKVTKRATPTTITLTSTSANLFPATSGAPTLSAVDGFYEPRTANATGQNGFFASTFKADAEL